MEPSNPNYAEHQRGLAEAHKRLGSIVRRYLPDVLEDFGEDAAVAAILDAENEAHSDIVAALDEAMVEASRGHTIGITRTERKRLGGTENPFVPDYLLGPGDQDLYRVLRDSNLLNAAVGRVPVVKARDLESMNYKADEEGDPIDAFAESSWTLPFAGSMPVDDRKVLRLAQAGRDHALASSMPVQHSTFFGGSPYPQHEWIGTPETLWHNTYHNNADGVLGQALNGMLKWEDSSKASSRMPENGVPMKRDGRDEFVGGVWKWLTNFPSRFMEHAEQEWARNAVNRASPLVPDRETDPEYRKASVENLRAFDKGIAPPDVKTYGESIGKGYSPAAAWAFDMGHAFADPATAASLGTSVVARFPYMLGRGYKGVLSGLAGEIGKAVPREGLQEAMSPFNYAVGVPTFPWTREAFRGYHVSPDMQQAAQSQVQEQREETKGNVQRIREARPLY